MKRKKSLKKAKEPKFHTELRLPVELAEAVKSSAILNERSFNAEISYVLKERYLSQARQEKRLKDILN